MRSSLSRALKHGFIQQLLRYLAVGGSAFLIDFGLLALLKSGLGWPASAAAAVAFLLSTVFSYAMQRVVTFKSNSEHAKSVLRYAVLLGFNTLATSAIVEVFDLYAHMYLFGKVVSTGLTTLWNFPLMRYWVYKSRREPATIDPAPEPADVTVEPPARERTSQYTHKTTPTPIGDPCPQAIRS